MTPPERVQRVNLVGWVLNPRVARSMHLDAWVKDPPYMLSLVAGPLQQRRSR